VKENAYFISYFIVKPIMLKNIGCASRARVNLPHIGNRECMKFVVYAVLFLDSPKMPSKLKFPPFLVRTCMESIPLGCQISKF
jgi:hypothetical protein